MLNSYLKAVKKGLRNDTNVDEILIAVKGQVKLFRLFAVI